MSKLIARDMAAFNESLAKRLEWLAEDINVSLSSKQNEDRFEELIRAAYKSAGPVVVLIDEYDKPILDCINDVKKAEEIRAALRTFYTVLKGCEEYLRFVLLTGISKFAKVGIFSAINNLVDISMDTQFGDIVGYTQQELEHYFSDWLDHTAERMKISRAALLERMEDYYDGFCFDGETRLYNPFSTLLFLRSASWGNYWYDSGSQQWIVQQMKRFGIKDPDTYRHIKVELGFLNTREIERAKPESFLYQSGYLSVERRNEDTLILDYPNREVRESISRMYLDEVYQVSNAVVSILDMRDALRAKDVSEAVRLFETMIFGSSYDVFARTERNEALTVGRPRSETDGLMPNQAASGGADSAYQLLFLLSMRGVNINAHGEVHNAVGRSDVEIMLDDCIIVLEFKYSGDGSGIEKLAGEGLAQIKEKGYARQHADSGKKIICGVVVIDDKKKTLTYTEAE